MQPQRRSFPCRAARSTSIARTPPRRGNCLMVIFPCSSILPGNPFAPDHHQTSEPLRHSQVQACCDSRARAAWHSMTQRREPGTKLGTTAMAHDGMWCRAKRRLLCPARGQRAQRATAAEQHPLNISAAATLPGSSLASFAPRSPGPRVHIPSSSPAQPDQVSCSGQIMHSPAESCSIRRRRRRPHPTPLPSPTPPPTGPRICIGKLSHEVTSRAEASQTNSLFEPAHPAPPPAVSRSSAGP